MFVHSQVTTNGRMQIPSAMLSIVKVLDENGEHNWVCEVRNLLFRCGSSYALIAQDNGNIQVFKGHISAVSERYICRKLVCNCFILNIILAIIEN